jgi:hypothetical protein
MTGARVKDQPGLVAPDRQIPATIASSERMNDGCGRQARARRWSMKTSCKLGWQMKLHHLAAELPGALEHGGGGVGRDGSARRREAPSAASAAGMRAR